MERGAVTEPAASARCPCLSGESYGNCCGPIHAGAAVPTAERLMRSRYSAYSVGLPDYLLRSWHSSTRPASLELDPDIRWRRLDIVATFAGGMLDTEGVVEFKAYFVRGTGAAREPGVQVERSSFVREDGRWVYLDGVAT